MFTRRMGAPALVAALVVSTVVASARAEEPAPPSYEGRPLAQWVEASKGADVDDVTKSIRVLSSEAVRTGRDATRASETLVALVVSSRWSDGENGEWVRRIATDGLIAFRKLDPMSELVASVKDGKTEAERRNARAAVERMSAHAATEFQKLRRKSFDHVSTLIACFRAHDVGITNPWPSVGGKAFVLWLVATNRIGGLTRGNLAVFFSPGDTTRSLAKAGGPEAYAAITLDALTAGSLDLSPFTSYVGRRNRDADAALKSPESGASEPIIADLSFRDGVVVGYTDGVVKWIPREELGIPPGEPITVGPKSRSPVLRLFSDR